MKYITYNRDFLLNDDFFNNKEIQELEKISRIIQINKNNVKNYKELFLNIAYATLRLEGYSTSYNNALLYLKTQNYQNTNHSFALDKEITILKNAYHTCNFIFNNYLNVSSFTTKTIHSMLSENLIATNGSMKIIDNEVQIRENIIYKPLSHSIEIESEFNFLFDIYKKISNPFNKCLFLQNNLAYLQYFEDCNKRTSRFMQIIAALENNIKPFLILFTNDNSTKLYDSYIESLTSYYETGSYKLSKEFFLYIYKTTPNFLKNGIKY